MSFSTWQFYLERYNMKLKAALQTMCINDAIEKEGAYEAFRKAKEIGYTDLEISGHINLTDEFIQEAEKARNDFGLNICAVSCEYTGQYDNPSFFPGQKALRLTDNYEEAVATTKKLHSSILRYAGQPVESYQSFEDVKKYCEVTEEYAKRLKKDGITLCAHNHEGEFARFNGKTAFEWSLELAPDLAYEMDIFGVQMSGMNPLDFLAKAKGRVPLIHFSDIAIKPGKDPRLTLDMIQRVPLGMGNFNVPAILKKAEEAGSEYFIMEAASLPGKDAFEVMALAKNNFDEAVKSL